MISAVVFLKHSINNIDWRRGVLGVFALGKMSCRETDGRGPDPGIADLAGAGQIAEGHLPLHYER